MRFSVLFASLLLAGCSTANQPLDPPIVDTRGVDQKRFLDDQAECIEVGRIARSGIIGPGQAVTKCMRERGYTILVPKG